MPDPKSNGRGPYKRKAGELGGTETNGRGLMKTEAETEMTCLRVKECPGWLGERTGTYSPCVPSKGTNPASILILGFWAPKLRE